MPGTVPTPFQTPVLFPFEPDAASPIVETVEYVTDVITSHNDTEDRIALRRRPKLHMKWKVTALDLAEAGRAAGLLWKMGNRWYVPLWQHARQVTALDNLAKVYSVDMTDSRYDFSGKVLLWKNSAACEVYDLVAALTDGVVLANSNTSDQLAYTNLTVAPWVGSAGAVLNQPGLDGTPNTATSLTDADATFQNRAASWAIPNNNSLHAVTAWVRKDAVARFPQLRVNLSGGTVPNQTGVSLNTATGAFISANTTGGGTISVRDGGTEWIVTLDITNNTSGHNFLQLTIYPTARASVSGADDAAQTGTIIVPKVVATLNPHTQLFTPTILDTYAIPLGIGTLSQSYAVERTNIVFGSDVDFELDTTAGSLVPALTPTQTFRSIELLNIHPDTDDGVDHENWTLSSERVGSNIGPFQIRLFATSPVVSRKIQWTLDGRTEWARFRKWLAARRGRKVPLWVPTYQNDLTLVAPAIVNAGSIDIAAVDFANKFMGSTSRVKIAVLENGVVTPLVVTSVTTPSAGVERLFLESTTPVAISLNAKVSFLLYARLSEDTVSISYHNTNLALVETSLTELPRETPA